MKNIHKFLLQRMVTLTGLLFSLGITEAWIGAKDVGGDNFTQFPEHGIRVGGSMWQVGEPNHASGNCVKLNLSGNEKLSAERCDVQLYFVCEIF